MENNLDDLIKQAKEQKVISEVKIKNSGLTDEDLFIIIRAMLWYNPIIEMPSNASIMSFIENARIMYKELKKR